MGSDVQITAMRLLTSRPCRVSAIVIFMIFLFTNLPQLPKDTMRDISLPGLSSPFPPSLEAPPSGVDWSRYAYVQYVTNTDYLCNSVMIFEALSRLNSKADRLMMFPSHFRLDDDSKESKLLLIARDQYGVHLVPITVQSRESNEGMS